ncbi:hypothetical protein Desmu_0901 [Desulfurococcus mucosus DSM 2162]|uniref:Uncharacterized protein n=2 Tax=Desulfurococcus mucosus TaxID=2275 RepID=E8R9M9_DESM0|nr:hypothetical protein [Desulfurococcus mucosus]ADV65205.1 hypothetical protein Desmu_0901 [Desulfurococcus mucosus DSM 2162]
MIVHIKKTRERGFDASVFSEYGYPFSRYKSVMVYVDDKAIMDADEVFVEAYTVKFIEDRKEVHVYSTPPRRI